MHILTGANILLLYLMKISNQNQLIMLFRMNLRNIKELSDISVSPRMVYMDANLPQLVEGFIKNTVTAMIEDVGKKAIEQGIVDSLTFEKGIKDLYRTAESDGVFCYTFFKGFGTKK